MFAFAALVQALFILIALGMARRLGEACKKKCQNRFQPIAVVYCVNLRACEAHPGTRASSAGRNGAGLADGTALPGHTRAALVAGSAEPVERGKAS